MTRRLGWAIALAAFILGAAFALRYAEGAGMIGADGARRAMQVLIGLMLAGYANIMPKQLGPTRGSPRADAAAQALGLRAGRLSRLVLLETTLMASLGFALGVILGAGLVSLLNYTGFSSPGMEEMSERFNLPGEIFPEATLLSLVLGPSVIFVGSLLAALYPALRLHRLKPVQAMRAV